MNETTRLESELTAPEDIRLEDCYVYHWFDTPDGRTIPGSWDLREGWRSYLGNPDLKGKRVLEIGPASGFLTFKMEQDGADVMCFDVAPGASPDMMPIPRTHPPDVRRGLAHGSQAVRSAWWYFHKMFGSNARVTYGDIYNMPQDIGTFDVSVIGSVLLHLSNPFAALTQVARLTQKTLIIAELYDPRLDGGAFMEVNPHLGKAGPLAWWLISPQACEHMLQANGFRVKSLTFNEFRHHPTFDPEKFRTHPIYTIVAERD